MKVSQFKQLYPIAPSLIFFSKLQNYSNQAPSTCRFLLIDFILLYHNDFSSLTFITDEFAL
jgi:hypothetical protein